MMRTENRGSKRFRKKRRKWQKDWWRQSRSWGAMRCAERSSGEERSIKEFSIREWDGLPVQGKPHHGRL